jgi:hypothetical protein
MNRRAFGQAGIAALAGVVAERTTPSAAESSSRIMRPAGPPYFARGVGRTWNFTTLGNKYRLVVAINYPYRMCYIRFVGSHQAYDRIDVVTV